MRNKNIMSLTPNILTREQINAGITLDMSDDHVVVLKHGNHIIGHYSALGVTIQVLRQDADTYLAGIIFDKEKK